jgi:hypothetical protein
MAVKSTFIIMGMIVSQMNTAAGPEFESAEDANESGREFSEGNSGEHAESNLQTPIALEKIQSFGGLRRTECRTQIRFLHPRSPIRSISFLMAS